MDEAVISRQLRKTQKNKATSISVIHPKKGNHTHIQCPAPLEKHNHAISISKLFKAATPPALFQAFALMAPAADSTL